MFWHFNETTRVLEQKHRSLNLLEGNIFAMSSQQSTTINRSSRLNGLMEIFWGFHEGAVGRMTDLTFQFDVKESFNQRLK